MKRIIFLLLPFFSLLLCPLAADEKAAIAAIEKLGGAVRGVAQDSEALEIDFHLQGEELTDADGIAHRMAGLLALKTSFAERQLHLGYRTVSTSSDCVLGQAAMAYRGHEFHYATVVSEDFTKNDPLFEAQDARGTELGQTGLVSGSVAGSFIHLVDRQD